MDPRIYNVDINIIACVHSFNCLSGGEEGEEWGIGGSGEMVWHIKADLTRFKTLTTAPRSVVCVGRVTWDGIKDRVDRKGDKRFWVVLTRTPSAYSNEEDVEYISSFNDVYDISRREGVGVVWVIGGRKVWKECFSLITPDKVFLTKIMRSDPTLEIHSKTDCYATFMKDILDRSYDLHFVEDMYEGAFYYKNLVYYSS